MQDHVEKVVEAAAPGQLPASLVAEIQSAGALIILSMDGNGALQMRGMVPGGSFSPTLDVTQAFVQAVYDSYPDLVARIHGKITDATRYAALRDFAVMAQQDPARFEQVNAMLQKFEDGGSVPTEAARTAADHDAFAEFLALAIQETEPELVAPTVDAAPVEEKAPVIYLPNGGKIAKPN